MRVRLVAMALVAAAGMLASSPANALPPDLRPQAPGGAAATPMVWLVETVAKGKVGQYSSIQVDDAGWPHIAFYDLGHGDLKYAYKDASGWHIETVDSGVEPDANVGGYASLALDALGQPNISYCRLGIGTYTQCEDLKYAIRLGGTWAGHVQTVDAAGLPAEKVGAYSSLAVEGGPDYEDMSQHISYYDQTNQQLKYCFGTGALWGCTVVDTNGDVGRYSSLALAGKVPHIAYQHIVSGTSTELKTARATGSIWVIERVDGPGANTGRFASLDLCLPPVITPAAPHIGYTRSGRLGYAYFYLSPTIPHWELATVDARTPSGISFRLDAGCSPHMSIYDASTGAVRYYHIADGGPKIETVTADGSLDPDVTTSLALDDSGQPHISFYADRDYGTLLYAHKVPGVFLPLLRR